MKRLALILVVMAAAGCRAPQPQQSPPLPSVASMPRPSLQSAPTAALVAPSPLRLVHPVPSLRWRGWNPSVGATITTTNTGLFGLDWVAPVEGRTWSLQVSSDLATWSDGVSIGDRWQGLFPFREATLFIRVLPE